MQTLVLFAFILIVTPAARAGMESVNFGYEPTLPSATDAIRLSTRIGYAWFSQNQVHTNPENGAQIPYAYHDGYVENIGVGTFDSVYAKNRWKSILDGNGDPFTGATGAQIGKPTIIILDEVNSNFDDTHQGPGLRNALSSFCGTTGYTRASIAMLFSPALSMGNYSAANFTKMVEATNSFVRFTCLEVYVSQQGFLTGYDPEDGTFRGTGDTYLANRLTFGIRHWTTTNGCDPLRIKPMFQVDDRAAYGSNNDFYQFLNRCFWFTANGWYNSTHSGVDANVKTAFRQGVGSYTWLPNGVGLDKLTPNANRDTYFEKYEWFYCTNGALSAHPDGVLPPP